MDGWIGGGRGGGTKVASGRNSIAAGCFRATRYRLISRKGTFSQQQHPSETIESVETNILEENNYAASQLHRFHRDQLNDVNKLLGFDSTGSFEIALQLPGNWNKTALESLS